jgi:VCBS repeat-containing protein
MKQSSRLRVAAHLLLLLLFTVGLHAATTTTKYVVLFDVDNSTASGCSYVAGSTTVSGIEQVLTTTVTSDGTTAAVTKVERQQCSGGTFTTPPFVVDSTGWPAQISDGTTHVVTHMPYPAFGPSVPLSMRLYFFVVESSTVSTGVTQNPEGSAITYPQPGPRHRAVSPTGEPVVPTPYTPDGNLDIFQDLPPLPTGIPTTSGSPSIQFNNVVVIATSDDLLFLINTRTSAPAGTLTAVDDSYFVQQGHGIGAGSPGVLSNDINTTGSPMFAQLMQSTHLGTLHLNADGSFSYQNSGAPQTSDTFTYKATAGGNTSDPATVTFHIFPDGVPVAVADAYPVAHSGTLTVPPHGVLTNDSDPDHDALSAVLDTPPSHASAFTLNSDGSFNYTHDGSNTLSDTFKYRATDNIIPSSPATVTITVGPDAAPVAQPDVYTTAEGSNLTVTAAGGVLANDTDVDTPHNQLTATVGTPPAHAASFTLNADGSFSYTHDGSETLADSFTYTLSDGIVTVAATTVSITITPVNDPPVLTAGGTLAYTENDAPTAIDTTITVADPDSANLAGATAQITANYVNGQDVLSFANTANITGSFNAATGTMTLSGSDTLANYQAALRAVQYSNLSENPNGASRTVTWQVNDGAGANNLSNMPTSTITVTAVNDAPVNSVPAAQSVNEDTALVFSSGGGNAISVSDVDAGSASVQVQLTATNGTVTLSGTGGLTINAGANGSATVTVTGTMANINAALNGLSFLGTVNFSGAASLQIVTNDLGNSGSGGPQSATNTVPITVNPVNDAPVLTAGGTLGYTENDAPTAIDTTITVSDVDNANLASATAQITSNYVNGQDVLSFTNTATITGSFNAATGTLTLTGSDTLANYQTALRSVKYANTSDNPSVASRTVTWIGNDGATTSSPVTSTITVTAVNDAPVLAAGGTLGYTENQVATTIDTTITITDPDSTNLTGATAQITANYVNGEDILSFATLGAITGSFNAATGTMTLSGSDTPANYQTALRSIKYNNLSDNPSAATRTVTWQVNDGAAANNLSNTPTSSITVTPVNDAPVLTAGATLGYTENQAATAIDTTITVSDADNTNLASATAQITANYVNGQDVLSFANTATITGSFNAATGTMTLTGSDTLANYQAALRSVKYANTSDNPSVAPRTVTWIANDGATTSSPVTSTINITPVNDAPVLTAGATLGYTENQAATAIDTTITVTDIDSAILTGATVQITANYVNGEDVLSFATIGAISGSFNAATGTLTLTGTDTLANYQAALRTVKYANTSDNPSGATRTVTWQVNDGGAVANLSNTPTSSITVTPVDDAPVLTAGATLTYTEADAPTAVDTTVTVNDVDSTTLTGATVQLTTNYINGQDILSFVTIGAISGSFNAATGTMTLTGTDTLANYQAALRTVKYSNTSTSPSVAPRTAVWIGNDGTLTSSPVTSTINVISVNTAPTITAGATLSYTENQAATAIDTTVTVSDPDTATMAFATVQITGNYVNGEDVLSFATIGAISGSFNAATGTLTLTGTDTVANYQAALRTVKYNNTSDNPSALARTVSWTIDDGDPSNHLSNTATSTINVTPVNDPPVLTVASTLGYTENDAATAISPLATVTDPDNTTMAGATVQITANYVNGEDILSATAAGSISVNFTAATGTLTLSGTDSLANYQTVLRSVKYFNNSDNPSGLARTVSWIVNDGTDPSATQTTTVNVTPVNDAPVITAGGTLNYTENDPASVIDNTITAADIDNANLTGATVTISANYNSAQDVLSFATIGAISGSFNTGTGVLTLTGTDTVANYQAALRTVKYANTSDNPASASRTVSWQVNDGAALSNVATSTVTVTPVNDAPVLTAGGTLNYTENDAATAIDATITVTDSDSTNLTGATAQITSNYVNGEDILSFTTLGAISGSFNAATGTMTLSGTDTLANYQTALRSIKYNNLSDNPSGSSRTVTWQVNDGAAANNLSNTPTSTINVTPVNDAPVLTAGASLGYTENQAATVIDTTITATDADSTNFTGATVQITGNYVNGQDVLSFATIGAISGSFNAVTGTLTLTGTDTVANYQAALRTVKYANTSDNPSTLTRTVTWQVDDGAAANNLSNTPTSSITITAVNDAPVVTAGATLGYTENQAATAIDTTITVSDVDSANLTGATAQITANYVNGEDILSFATIGAISGSFNAATGTMTLTGTDTVANYQAALRTIKYNNTSENPSGATRTVTWQVNDGGAVANLSNTPTSSITVTPVNDAPVLTAGATLTYTEGDPATALDTTVTVNDVDNTNLTGATVQLTTNYVNGQDILSFATIGAISGSFNAATGTMTLTGTDTLANYQAALRTVKYNNTSTSPSAAPRTVVWIGTDGTTPSSPVTSSITVISINTAPTITAGGTLNYTENQAAAVVDNTITITDPDTATMAFATVQITGNYVNGEDVLSFATIGAISGSFNAATGTLTLTGTDTTANYQAALRTVKYANTSDNPSTAARTVSWQVDDGDSTSHLSNTATSTINVTAVNDAPTLTVAAALAYTENDPATAIAPAATVTDPDNTTLTGGTVSITGNFNTAQDVLSATNTGSITASYNSVTGVLTLSGTDTLANYQTVLRSVKYQNSSDNPSPLTRTVSWIVTDGTTPSTTQTTTITITSVNDAPVITAGSTLSYTENAAATVIDNTITVSDADSANLTGATVSITSNFASGQDVLSFATIGAISASYNAGTGVLTLSGVDTVANYQAALRTVKYANSSDNPSTLARTISWVVTDGLTPSAGATSTINVTAVNDAPVVSAGGPLNYTENDPATAVSTTLTVTDVDSTNLTGATAQITGNYNSAQDVLSFATIGAISGSFNSATGTMTLTGTDTVANYQAALRTIKYNNTSDSPTTASRTVTWLATDGAATSSTQTSTINVTSVNDAPVLTAGAALGYTENQAATAIDTTITAIDVDSANLTGATVVISANYVNGQDILSFTTLGAISGSFNAATGTLTLTGTDTVANYQAALRTVKYNNTSDNPSTLARTVTWQVNDGAGVNNLSNTPTSTINVTSVNDAPVVVAGGPLNYTENQAATAVSTTLTVTDADSATLTGATAQISANYVNGQDILSFATIGAISGSFNAATGTMTLTGTDTVANYQAALRTITYQNTSENPSASPRTVSWQVNDGAGVNNLSTVVNGTINVTPVNDAPVLTAGATLTYTENDPATVIDNTITVSDVDSANFTGATVSITANFNTAQDVLSFATIGAISGSYNAATGVLTLTGTDTLANYQAALRTVKYANTSDNPTTASRTITWVGNDGAAANNLSTGVTSSITVIAVNDPPVLATTSTLNYTENDVPTAINTLITATDVDSTNLTGATVQITTNYNSAQDVLSFTTLGTITGSFNSGTGTMTLSGTATVANYQTALRSVKYANTSDDPTTLPRTVVFQVDDGGTPLHASNTITSTINVTAVNDPPTAFSFSGLPAQAGIPITYPAAKLGGSDLEAGTTITIDTTPTTLVNMAAVTINANGSFTVTPTPGSAGSTASFQYRVSDNGNPGPGVTGSYVTVSFTVAGPAIYFVKNPAAGTANCTLGNECLLATALTNIGASTNSYIYLGDAASHTGTATLNSGGSIIGQGITTAFDTFFGIGAPAQGVLATRPTTSGAFPTVVGTVTLNTNSQARGFNIAPGNNASGIIASGKTGLQVDVGTITTNTPGGPTTYGVDISGASSGTLFKFGAINATGVGAGANGVRFAATSTTTVTFGTIATTAGKALDVSGSGATTFTFGNISSTTGAAVTVGTTSGNFTFGTVTSTTGTAITTTSTGAGNFSFTTVSTTTGQAVSITTGTGAFTFTKISAGTAGAGPAKGISVNGLTGSFKVNGTGGLCDATHISGADCTGGTIQKTTARGAEFINSNNITLNTMYFKTNSSTVAGGCNANISSGANTTCNGPIFIQTATGTTNGAALDKIFIDGSSQMGIVANGVANFSLTNSEIENVGSVAGVEQSGLDLQNLSGTGNAITGCHIHDNDWGHNVFITANTGTGTINFTNNTVDNVSVANPAHSDGFQAQSYLTANMTVTVSNTGGTCTFNKLYANGVQMAANSGSTMNGTLSNCTITKTSGVFFQSAGTSTMTGTISTNTITNKLSTDWTAAGNGSNAITIAKSSGASVGTFTGIVTNNIITSAHCGGGCAGIASGGYGNGTTTMTITGNNVQHVDQEGINFITGQGSGTSNNVVTIQGNTVTNPDASGSYAIEATVGTQSGDHPCVVMNFGDMSVGHTVAANKNSVSNGTTGFKWVPTGGGSPSISAIGNYAAGVTGTLKLPNLTGGTTDAAAQAWIIASNTGASSDAFNGAAWVAGATCP